MNQEENIELTDDQLDDIAMELHIGMLTFAHKKTGEVLSHPAPDDIMIVDDTGELYADQIKKIKENRQDYVRFERMDSREAFQVMENFAESIEDPIYKGRFVERLTMRKPFANFKQLVHDSPYRQDWFDFKAKAYRDYLKNEFEHKMKYGEEDDYEYLW